MLVALMPVTTLSSIAVAAGWMVLVLLLALVVDRRFGEPRVSLHPVVWMGRYLTFFGIRTTRLARLPAFVFGALAWCLGAVLAGLLAGALQTAILSGIERLCAFPSSGRAVWAVAVVGTLLAACLLKCMLSWRMLHDEVGAVEAALQQSLEAGRERLSWLVSRDTTNLSASEVRESAIESLAENLNDSVVAPIFWFVVFGLPGAAVYRFANTADAMWGYRGLRHGVNWEWAGKWAARADDLLSWLPARLTALLLAWVAGGVNLQALRIEARKTPSPNSGWPMAAMALALNIRLGKPGVYTLHAAGEPPLMADTASAQKYASKVVLWQASLGLLAIILIACARWGLVR